MCDDVKPVGGVSLRKDSTKAIEPSSIKMLVIDDQLTIRELLYEILSKDGYVVKLAISSDEGLKYFHEDLYDVVYADLSMPGKSGLEVAFEIKRRNPETIVILITGWALEEEMDKKQLKENGIDLVITKPFRVQQIRESVEQAIKMKQEMSS